MSGSCSFLMESLGPDLQRQLRETGVAVLPLPAEARALLAESHRQERPWSRMQKLGALMMSHLRDARGLPQWVRGLGRVFRDLTRVPRTAAHSDYLAIKACQQYALPNFAENWILLDTGHAKLMTSHWSGDVLHRMPGMEGAVPAGPLGGSRGNSMRFLAQTP
jgi:hypothetical protein